MKVVDNERSERGQQRRRNDAGSLLHCCCICGHLDVWGDGWSTYCSEKDLDDGVPIPKFCSSICRDKGGPKASNVTPAMKEAAREAEWREPIAIYREATEAEKYRAACDAQNKFKR